MSGVIRWNPCAHSRGNMLASTEGQYILLSDHHQSIAALESQVAELRERLDAAAGLLFTARDSALYCSARDRERRGIVDEIDAALAAMTTAGGGEWS